MTQRQQTPRTATTQWKNVRRKVIAQARREGLEHCPSCKVKLVWEGPRQAASAEVDHIIPHSRGGADDPSQCRVICRRCNQSLGAKIGNTKRHQPAAPPTNVKPQTGRTW